MSAISNLRAVWLIAAFGFGACGGDESQDMNPVTGAGAGAPAVGSAAGAGTTTAGSFAPAAGSGAAGSGIGTATAGAPMMTPGMAGSAGSPGRGTSGRGMMMGPAGGGAFPGTGGRSSVAGTSGGAAGTGAPAGTGGLAGSGSAGGSAGSRGGQGGAGAGISGSGAAGGGSASGATFTQVYGVIMQGCGCHVSGSQGGLALMNQSQAYMNLVGANSGACSGQKRVVAGDPDNSVLVHAVERTMLGSCRVPAMPAGGGPKLPAASLEIIRSWVQAGAKND